MEVCYSPQLRSTNMNSTLISNSGAHTNPGTPDYGDDNVGGFQRGWYSERVPLPSNSSRRHISATALMPFNSGRTLPSKWDDAERWITSPLSGFGVCNTLASIPRRRRSHLKSGSFGETPESPFLSNYSLAMPVFQENFLPGSPLTTGVLVPDPDGLSFHHAGRIDYLDSQDENLGRNGVSRVISRRDKATQMSPETSPTGSLSLSNSSPSIHPPLEPCSHQSNRMEVKDVQVDKGAILTKQSRKRGTRLKKDGSPEPNSLALAWSFTTEREMNLSKIKKEEARITAWENLQNAKAEASIQKLEMKLEKKKSASMDKILNKHRVAQRKAQEMRSMSGSAASQAPRIARKLMSLPTCLKISLIGRCFHGHHS